MSPRLSVGAFKFKRVMFFLVPRAIVAGNESVYIRR